MTAAIVHRQTASRCDNMLTGSEPYLRDLSPLHGSMLLDKLPQQAVLLRVRTAGESGDETGRSDREALAYGRAAHARAPRTR